MTKKKEWTPARKKSFITSVLRSGSRRWPAKYDCIKEAYVETKINPKSGRLAKHYQCAKCGDTFTSTNIQVDHIEPIIGPKGFTTWDDYIEKLFCPIENLQTLCKECHKAKTKRERGK